MSSANDEIYSLLVPLKFSVDARTNSIVASGSSGDLAVVEAILRDGGTQALSGELMRFGQFNELIGLEEYSQLMNGGRPPKEGGRR